MADISKFQVVIGADIKGLQKSLGKVQSSLSSFGKKATAVGKNMSMSLTAPIAALGTLAVREFTKVDKTLREVNTLFGLTGKEAEKAFSEMKGGVRALSNELGIAQNTLSQGLYQAISAGVPKDNVFEFMRVASQASVAGVTDVETAVDGLSTIINAFGLDASQAQEVADSMFTTVKGGKTDFQQLSSSLFNVAPAAAAAGISFKDVNAALATLTASGTPTSVATTQIRAAITALSKPSEELTKIFQEAGYESGELALKQAGLQKSLQIVRDASGGSSAKLTQLLGTIEAVSAVNVLAGTSSAKFASELQAQGKAAGATSAAFGEMEKSASKQFEKLQVTIQNLAIDFGEALLPIVLDLVGVLKSALGVFTGMTAGGKKMVVMVAALVAGIGPAVAIFGALGTAISFMISPIGLVVAGVAGLTAAIVYAADNWDAIVERLSDWSWWKGMLMDMAIFLLENSPISMLMKMVNEALAYFGQAAIPDPFAELAVGLRLAREETKQYEHEFGSFSDAVGNAMDGVQKFFKIGNGGGGGGTFAVSAPSAGGTVPSGGGQQLGKGIGVNEGAGVSILSKPIEATKVDLDSLKEKMDEVASDINAKQQEMASVAMIVADATGDAFANLGHNVVNSLGLAEDGMQGFLRSFLSSAVEIIANALSISMANAILAASGAAAQTGIAAPVTMPIFLAQMTGAVIGAFAAIPKFANGGIVGGTQYSGDNIMARVNSGEMILNSGQQNQLFNMLNGGGTMGGDVHFRIQGSDLIGSIDRENRRRVASGV